jgi:hypothetical protein
MSEITPAKGRKKEKQPVCDRPHLQLQARALMVSVAARLLPDPLTFPGSLPEFESHLVSELNSSVPSRLRFVLLKDHIIKCWEVATDYPVCSAVLTPDRDACKARLWGFYFYLLYENTPWKKKGATFNLTRPDTLKGEAFRPGYLSSNQDLLDDSPDLPALMARCCVTRTFTVRSRGESHWAPCFSRQTRVDALLAPLTASLIDLGLPASCRWVSRTPTMLVLRVDASASSQLFAFLRSPTLPPPPDLALLRSPGLPVHLITEHPMAPPDLTPGGGDFTFTSGPPGSLAPGQAMYPIHLTTLRNYRAPTAPHPSSLGDDFLARVASIPTSPRNDFRIDEEGNVVL